jgi:hypothetical protein
MNDSRICDRLVAFQPEALMLKRAGSAQPDIENESWQIPVQPNPLGGMDMTDMGAWNSPSDNRIPVGWRFSSGVIPVVSGAFILISREVTES